MDIPFQVDTCLDFISFLLFFLFILSVKYFILMRFKKHLPLSTFVIDIPLRGVRITRKHSDVERNFMKLRLSPSLSLLLRIAAAFLSISDDLHDDVDEFCESRLDFFKQMQLRNIFFLSFFYSFTE